MTLRPLASCNLVRPDYHRQTILTYAETALTLGLSVKTVYRLAHEGRLGQTYRNGAYRVQREAIENYRRGGI